MTLYLSTVSAAIQDKKKSFTNRKIAREKLSFLSWVRDRLPVSVTWARSVKGGHREQEERNHTERSIFSDAVMRVGYLFHHSWHLKDTPQRCPDNSYEAACLLGCEVRVEWHLVFLPLCSGAWCRLFVEVRDVCLGMFVMWGVPVRRVTSGAECDGAEVCGVIKIVRAG